MVSLQWMMQNRRISRNCILGDEMVRTPNHRRLATLDQCAVTNMAKPISALSSQL